MTRPGLDGHRSGRTRLALTCAAASSVAFFDSGAFVLAVPEASRDLGAGLVAGQLWVAGPLVVVAALVLPAGWLGDRFGRLRVLRIGLSVTTVASVAAALAPAEAWLTAMRFTQGIGFALFVPTSLALLRQASDSAAAVRTWTVVVSVTTLAAPAVAALLLTVSDWRALFSVEIVVALGALASAATLRVGGSATPLARATPTVYVLFVAGSGGVIFGATWQRGGPSWPLVLSGLAAVLAALFTLRRRDPAALPVSAALLNGFTFLAYGALAVVPFLLSLALQAIDAHGPGTVGLLLSLEGLVLAGLTPLLGHGRWHPVLHLGGGAAVSALGTAWLAWISASGNLDEVAPVGVGLAVLGTGAALFVAPLTNGVLAAVTPAAAGRAAGLNLSLARLSAAAAVALVGPLLTVAALNSAAERAPSCCPDAIATFAHGSPLDPSRAPASVPEAAARRGADIAAAAGLAAASLFHATAAGLVVLARRSLP